MGFNYESGELGDYDSFEFVESFDYEHLEFAELCDYESFEFDVDHLPLPRIRVVFVEVKSQVQLMR